MSNDRANTSERVDGSVPRCWTEDVPVDTEILYIAIGCADWGKKEKLYQVFPTFIKYAIDQGRQVKILAADTAYTGVNAQYCITRRGEMRYESKIDSFLKKKKNIHYQKFFSFYSRFRLDEGEDFILNFFFRP